MNKRICCRSLVIIDDKLVTMYREKQDKIYYTFPGGGLEGSESLEECTVRETLEEFGITVKPIKLKYFYETDKQLEYFYLCHYQSGEFGSGSGEEFDRNNTYGKYIPTLLNLDDIPNYNLLPPQIAKQFYNDYKTYGKDLGDEYFEFKQ